MHVRYWSLIIASFQNLDGMFFLKKEIREICKRMKSIIVRVAKEADTFVNRNLSNMLASCTIQWKRLSFNFFTFYVFCLGQLATCETF